LRLALNRELQLGLFEYECHFARYAPGAFYRKHVDRFSRDSRRRLSSILYLNPAWAAADGGALRLYMERTPESARVDIAPAGGTLVLFLSERFPHEVLPATRERLSLTGWFKTRD
jgi:SM-20-related protein